MENAAWYAVRWKGEWTNEFKGFCGLHIKARWSAGVSQYYEKAPTEIAPKEPAVCIDCQREQ